MIDWLIACLIACFIIICKIKVRALEVMVGSKSIRTSDHKCRRRRSYEYEYEYECEYEYEYEYDTATAFGLRFPPSAIRTDGRTDAQADGQDISCPHGPREHMFERFLAVRMVLANTFLKNISGPGVSALRPKSEYFWPWC